MSPLYFIPEIVIVLGAGVLIIIAFRLHKWLIRLSPDPRTPCAGRLRQTNKELAIDSNNHKIFKPYKQNKPQNLSTHTLTNTLYQGILLKYWLHH